MSWWAVVLIGVAGVVLGVVLCYVGLVIYLSGGFRSFW